MAYSVRLANSDDIDTLVRMRMDYSLELHGSYLESYEARKESTKGYFERHLNKDCFAAIVEEDGKAVSMGLLTIQEVPPSPARINGITASMAGIWTYPEYRRRGYAALTVSLLILKARENGASYIELSATPKAKPLYESLGFTVRQSDETDMRYRF